MRVDICIKSVNNQFSICFSDGTLMHHLSENMPVFINNKPFISIISYDRWGVKILLFRASESERKTNSHPNLIRLIKKDGRKPLAFFREGMKGSLALSSKEMRKDLFKPKA
jgi:hypothetical protein